MSATKIEWCDEVINPIVGCSKCSPGCDNCYAERFAARLAKNPKTAAKYAGVVDEHGKWTGRMSALDLSVFERLPQKPKKIFVGSMTDLFHTGSNRIEQFWALKHVFEQMTSLSQHTFMVLTKRPERALAFVQHFPSLFPRDSNIWMGFSICNQQMADDLLSPLRYTHGNYFLSLEPLLGPVTLEPRHGFGGCMGTAIKWIICGGETGPGARPMHPDWVRSLREQCQDAGVPFFFKGWGGWMPNDVEIAGHGRIGTWWNDRFYDNYGNIRDNSCNMQRIKSRVYGHRLLDGFEWNEAPHVS